jgi:PTS system mannose-specific IID component
MGPVAGFGDPVFQGVLLNLILTVGISLAVTGNVLGAVVVIVGNFVAHLAISSGFGKWAYKGGSRAAEVLFSGDIMEYIMKGAKILGCAAFGALAANVVRIGIIFAFDINGYAFNLQKSLFDAIIPGIVPLLVTLLTFSFLKKGFKVTRILFSYLVIAFIGGSLRILG